MRLLALLASALLLPCITVPQQQWTLDPDNWTVMQATTGVTTIIYVSSSKGDDAYDGLHPEPISATQGPRKTIQGGYAALFQLGNGPHWLLLRAGDTFSSPLDAISWGLSGTSTSATGTTGPMVFGSYYEDIGPPQLPPAPLPPRPKIRLTDTALNIFDSSGVRYLLITGIQFEHPGPYDDPVPLDSKGIRITGGTVSPNQWVRIEDCYINGWFQGIAIDPFPTTSRSDISIRRCVLVDNYRVTETTEPPAPVINTTGLYVEQTDGLLVEECVFDRNGWDGVNYSSRHVQNHNIYIQHDCRNVTVIGNISARGSADNYMVRPIGVIEKNLSLKTPIHFSIGTPLSAHTGDIVGNVALIGDDIHPADPNLQRGWAYYVQNVDGTLVQALMRYNIAAHKGYGGVGQRFPVSLCLDGSTGGIHNMQVHHNIVYKWDDSGDPLAGDPSIEAPLQIAYDNQGFGISLLTVQSNDIQNAFSQGRAFLAPVQVPNPSVPNFVSYNNRFWTGKQPAPTFMEWCGLLYDVPGWRAQVGDPPSGQSQSEGMQVQIGTQPTEYPDPSRNIVSYYQSLTPTPPAPHTLEAFLAECRQQRRGYWRTEFTGRAAVQYFQAGFNMTVP